jgi:hypothetical protein
MRRIMARLLIGSLTFLAGAILSNLWLLYNLPVTSLPEPLRVDASQPEKAQTLKIVGGMDACGPTANYHDYELSDGTGITTTCEQFSTVRRANEELQKGLGRATEIIERKAEFDDKGRKIGEKVIAKASGVILLRTSGRNFCSTDAASLEHLQWLEQR